VRRYDLPTIRAALWTLRSLVRARRALRKGGLADVELSDPPQLPGAAARGVYAVLRRQPNTCLERAIVLQRWLRSRGSAMDVVIGVKGGSRDFEAHAWLDGELVDPSFTELTRLPPP
jgi:Transglutaminase-like superfamily